MNKIIYVTHSDFQKVVLENTMPILVDFWADWCGPCKSINPILEKLAQEQEEVVIAKVDVQTNNSLAAKYEITSIPCLLLFEKGKVTNRIAGADIKAIKNLVLKYQK